MEWLNYHHLRYFWFVAREGSIAAAARKLRVSQPSVSVQIRELEEALGAKLFERQGRRNVLTDAGRLALRHADEIFATGAELVTALRQRSEAPDYRLFVGVADALPKLVTYVILQPVINAAENARIICREGKMKQLLRALGEHRLDIVLSDEPATSLAGIAAYNHPLGESDVCFCATPDLAALLRKNFPRSLDGVPALLPAETTTLRQSLDNWFRARDVQPRILAEFEDSALMKVIAAHGEGFTALPRVVAAEAEQRYGLVNFAVADGCQEKFFAITAQRRITHPLVGRLTDRARQMLFA